ncbi:MAG: sigma-54 dependent transcriptional regulator [Puniceicoccales bacterium]|jgi:two-component system nitrogen regulation response regulator GlnG|nr:sigma-54 dependent transcriptional regulator [Puniceicoccales bacterium]
MSKETKILVVDDDRDMRYSLKRILASEGYAISEAASGEKALSLVKSLDPDVILLDNRMDKMSGIETLQHLRTSHPRAMTILMTAYGTTQTVIEAMKYGAFDYIMKPFDKKKIRDLVRHAVQTLGEQAAAADAVAAAASDKTKQDGDGGGQIKNLRERLASEHQEAGIVGDSRAMQTVIKTIGQIAASDVTVLITGESGTGKELVARCLHRHSLRERARFFAVNCAAIPEDLIESELFGHEKGAFTGATGQKLGKFEMCDNGTIFLDEIGDMASPTQTKILRAIQEGEIQRVGGTEVIKINVRLVAATNKDLNQMVADKTFREDLYYRLNVVRLQLPPLRERKEDIPLLVDYMFQRLVARRKIPRSRPLAPEAIRALQNYDWPGNVRELENAIYRAGILARGETVMLRDFPPEILKYASLKNSQPLAVSTDTPPPPPPPPPKNEPPAPAPPASPPVPVTDEKLLFDQLYLLLRKKTPDGLLPKIENQLVVRAMRETNSNIMESAKILGISRATIKKRMPPIKSTPGRKPKVCR